MTLLKSKQPLLMDSLEFFKDEGNLVLRDGAIHIADVRSYFISSGLDKDEVDTIFSLLKHDEQYFGEDKIPVGQFLDFLERITKV